MRLRSQQPSEIAQLSTRKNTMEIFASSLQIWKLVFVGDGGSKHDSPGTVGGRSAGNGTIKYVGPRKADAADRDAISFEADEF